MLYLLLFPRIYVALWLMSGVLYAAYHILALDAYFTVNLRWQALGWPGWVRRVAWASFFLVVVVAGWSGS